MKLNKRNTTTTTDATPVVDTTTPTTDATPVVVNEQQATGTVAHDGTPAVIAPAASAALAAAANAKVVTGIPYEGIIRTTGAGYAFKGIRGQIYNLLRDGMTVAEFVKAARAGYRGGIEDVRIYVRKGIAVVTDANGTQVYPPKTEPTTDTTTPTA